MSLPWPNWTEAEWREKLGMRDLYSKDQPRHPKGDPKGGQFAPADGGAASSSVVRDSVAWKVRAAEDQIRHLPIEHVRVLSRTGDVLHAITNDKPDEVLIPDDVNLADSIFTHNHPRGTAFSREDVKLAVKDNVAEMRVATKTGAFILTRPDTGWPSQLPATHARYDARVHEEWLAEIVDGRRTIEQANAEHWTEVMRRTVQEWPLVKFRFEEA